MATVTLEEPSIKTPSIHTGVLVRKRSTKQLGIILSQNGVLTVQYFDGTGPNSWNSEYFEILPLGYKITLQQVQ